MLLFLLAFLAPTLLILVVIRNNLTYQIISCIL